MFHLHIRRVSRSRAKGALSRLDYIRRQGRYLNRGDVVRLVVDGAMPNWALGDLAHYWRALDHESMRANARILYSVEAAIPRALTPRQQNDLTMRFTAYVARMSAGRPRRGDLPHVLAIHEGLRSDDAITGRQPNPHMHCLFSTSIHDGVSRSVRQWFRRANSVEPKLGGAPRSTYIGQLRWLYRVREAWARMANAALRMAGLPATLDHRSHYARGLVQLPTRHLGPKEAARARAGKPSRKASQNEAIRRFNAKLEAAQAMHRAAAQRCKEAQRSEEEDREGLKEALKRERRNVHRILEAHPLAGGMASLLGNAAVLLVCRDASHPVVDIKGDGIRGLLADVLREVGPIWSPMRVHDRLWLIEPNNGDLVVIGPGFVASEHARLAGVVARVARALRLGRVIGYANDDGRAEVMRLVGDEADQMNLQCDWRDRKTTKPVLPSRP